MNHLIPSLANKANVRSRLARYDFRWAGKPDSELRKSLVGLLARCKRGEFDHLYKAGGSGGG
jgi:hypothetical protein